MDSKSDYFHSPAPRNIECFYSPFKLVRHDEDPFFINALLVSPSHLISSSPFSLCSHYHMNEDESSIQQKGKEGKKIQEIILFEKQESEESDEFHKIQTPMMQSKVININTTSSRKYELRASDFYQKKHVSRGTETSLRVLSKLGYEIFHYSQALTYKEVAEKIIQKTQKYSQYSKKNKEKQSIKRRVYDALNVLIAVGKLQKNGKKISLQKKEHQKQAQLNKLKKEIQNKNKIMEIKKKKYEQTIKIKVSIKNLIKRNMTTSNITQNIIEFPFLICQGIISQQLCNITKIKNFICAHLAAISFLSFNSQY